MLQSEKNRDYLLFWIEKYQSESLCLSSSKVYNDSWCQNEFKEMFRVNDLLSHQAESERHQCNLG